jgi:hypothetical protein
MKNSLLALMAVLLSALPGAAATGYKDAQGNLYFDGIPAHTKVQVQYNAGNPSIRKHQMYLDTRRSCRVHRIWDTQKLRLSRTATLFGTPNGTINYRFSLLPFAVDNANPCNGANRNTALSWTQISPGILAVRTWDSTFNKYCQKHPNYYSCKEGVYDTDTVYLWGLPSATYQISDNAQVDRFAKVDACGILKLANSTKWAAYANDDLTIWDLVGTANYGRFKRSTLVLRQANQIPKCLGGVRFVPSL